MVKNVATSTESKTGYSMPLAHVGTKCMQQNKQNTK